MAFTWTQTISQFSSLIAAGINEIRTNTDSAYDNSCGANYHTNLATHYTTNYTPHYSSLYSSNYNYCAGHNSSVWGGYNTGYNASN